MANLTHIHNRDAAKAFQNRLDNEGKVGKDQIKMEKIEAQMGNDLEDDSYAIDVFDSELYECETALYGSEKEATEDYEALLALCDDSKTYKIPCSWEMYGHMEIRATSLEDALAEAECDSHPLPSGDYIMGSFRLDHDMIAENGRRGDGLMSKRYRIKYADTGYVMGKDGEPLVFECMEDVWEEIGAYLSPNACDAEGITIEEV